MSSSIKNLALSATLVLGIAIALPALAEQNADSSQQGASMMQDDMSGMDGMGVVSGMDGMMSMMKMMAEMQPMMETCNSMMKAMMASMGEDATSMQPDSMSNEPPVNG